ncbi:GNAT family N-acetyltransferase [Aromatoleum aromaticum]|uniref:GNAT family N-acetyltransferase n=1 Tax=Aromatoleum aromaticum TaxID=551760 RepID=UPI00145985DA|nr:GNAT family N-acetyltransferase [Aromatoleum aromaticum]NMG55181.1 GNAT family N-acetyltransferase [Aromatoleum aromaticum]
MSGKRVIRPLRRDDLEAMIAIDEMAFKRNRCNYFERKAGDCLDSAKAMNSSLVCEVDGKVVGFIIGQMYTGEFGIPESTATIDTLGVHPDVRGHGIASEMLDQFITNMKEIGVRKVFTLVNWSEFGLEKFFSRHKFVPSKRINLEFRIP